MVEDVDRSLFWRLFVAISLPMDVRRRLETIVSSLRVLPARIGWVPQENLHLTVLFIGEVAPDAVDRVRSAMAKALRAYGSFRISLRQLGVFPEKGPVRTLWIGLDEGTEVLSSLAHDLRKHIGERGIVLSSRRFLPHVTLGRVRSHLTRGPIHRLIGDDGFLSGIAWTACSCELMRSVARHSGPPEYIVVHDEGFGGMVDATS